MDRYGIKDAMGEGCNESYRERYLCSECYCESFTVSVIR